MQDQFVTFEQRCAAIDDFVERRVRQGFEITSRSETTAQLFKPAGFPAFLRPEETIYVEVDRKGQLWVRKKNY